MRDSSLRKGLVGACMIGALITATPAMATVVYNATADFSLSSNPDGPWSYLSNGVLLTRASSWAFGGGLDMTWDNGIDYSASNPQKAYVTRNTSSAEPLPPNYTVVIATDVLNLDPEGTGNVAVRFTAPYTGEYTILGSFVGDDLYSVPAHTVDVKVNGTIGFSSAITQYGDGDNATFSLEEYLLAGDTIDFEVFTGGSPHHLSTGLTTVITYEGTPPAVPEPASIVVFAVGAIGAATARRRSRTGVGSCSSDRFVA